ncbi:MAG: type II toxin-antitoxin system RelE/ParE family toxin [Microbacteriaceae bacterium]
MRIRYTAGARGDLLQLRRYAIGRFDAATWSRSLAELHDRVALLVDQPRLGTVPPELEELGIDRYLELAIGRNRVIYRPRDDTVSILLVLDHRRDFRAALARRLLEPPTRLPGQC